MLVHVLTSCLLQEEFEDTECVIRSHKSKQETTQWRNDIKKTIDKTINRKLKIVQS